MTKDVLVRIYGVQQESGGDGREPEPIEVITPGTYYYKNGKHYILYEEILEDALETVRNRVKISGKDSLEITKTGATNAHMIFEKNKENFTYYQTAFGQMLMGVNTRDVEIQVSQEDIRVRVDYRLDINHEALADCQIRMRITGREEG